MTSSAHAAADGTHTTEGRPNSFSSLTPFIVIPGAAEAITFYTEVFGARLVDSTEFDGRIAHAELAFAFGRLQLGEPMPNYRLIAGPEGEDDCYSLGLYVPDVDDTVARALAAGATLREPLTNFASGDRFASVRDPFGVRWSIMTRIEDLTDAESAARVSEWAATAPGSDASA